MDDRNSVFEARIPKIKHTFLKQDQKEEEGGQKISNVSRHQIFLVFVWIYIETPKRSFVSWLWTNRHVVPSESR